MLLKEGFQRARPYALIVLTVLAASSAVNAGVFQALCHHNCPPLINGDFFGYYPTLWRPWPAGPDLPDAPGHAEPAGVLNTIPELSVPAPAKSEEEAIPSKPRPLSPDKEP